MSAITHQSPLLWIPLKQTDEVDVATPVRSLISSSYGEDPKKYSSALASLGRARTDAVRGASGSDRTARDLLYKWFHILEMLEVRFPEIRVLFTWKDAFTNKPISQYSLAYEKASVIFNIGSTLSAMAAATSRLGAGSRNPDAKQGATGGASPSSPGAHPTTTAATPTSASEGDGTKRAYTALRQAAGFFTYINDNFLHAPSTDMSRALLRFLVPLLLTQANEIFLEKTLAGKSSSGLIAKLASGVAQGYAMLAEESKEWIAKEVVDRVWGMMLQTKAKHYLSVAHYHRAQTDAAASQHGHSLVRLTLAQSLSKEANKAAQLFASNHTSSGPSALASTTFGYTNHTSSAYTMPSDSGTCLSGLVSAHLTVVSAARAQAVKDNDLIYHDILPSETALPAIDPTMPAQLISIQEVYTSPEVQKAVGSDLFAKLVPLGVHERASMYSEEKAKLARAEGEKCNLAEGERVATLDGMGLPAALEKFRLAVKKGSGTSLNSGWDTLADPGIQVMTWAEEEAAGGAAMGADCLSTPGTRGVNDALNRISSLRQAANADLSSATELLDDEARLCEKARAKHGLNWSQDPSGGQPTVKSLRADIKSNREAFCQGEDNDRRIESKWREVEKDVELLIQGRAALEQAFAEALASSGSAATCPTTEGLSLLDLSESEEQASDDAFSRLREDVEALDLNLVKLSKVKKERDSLLAELREKLQTDDIGHLLILSHKGGSKSSASAGDSSDAGAENPQQAAQEAALFRQELEKFRPWQQRLSQAVVTQGHLLAEISCLWQSINASSEGSRIARQWEAKSRRKIDLIARLGQARSSSAEIRAALGKGLQFYEEAGDIARGLKASAKEWSEQRGRERQKLEAEAEWEGKLESSSMGLESSLGGMSLGSSTPSTRSPATRPVPAPLPTPSGQTSYGYPASPGHAMPQPPPQQAPYQHGATSSPCSASLPPPPHQQQQTGMQRVYQSSPPLTLHQVASSDFPPLTPAPSQHAYSSFSTPAQSQQAGLPAPLSSVPYSYNPSSGQPGGLSSLYAPPNQGVQQQPSYGSPCSTNTPGLQSTGVRSYPSSYPQGGYAQYGNQPNNNSTNTSSVHGSYGSLPPPPPPPPPPSFLTSVQSSGLPPPSLVPPPSPSSGAYGYAGTPGQQPVSAQWQAKPFYGYGSSRGSYAAPLPQPNGLQGGRYGGPPPPPPPPSSQQHHQQWRGYYPSSPR